MVQAVSDNGCKSFWALENELVKIVSCYEADRVGKVKGILLIEFCLAVVAVFVCCLSRLPLFKANWFTEFGVPVLVIGSVIWGGLYILSKADSEFKNNLKERCMPHIVEKFGAMNWAVGKAVISNAKCRSSELFLQFEKRKDDDSFKGRYKGVSYAISETRLRDIYRHKGRDYDSYVFDGVLINFSSNKNIEATTIVTTKGDRYIKNKNPFFVFALIGMIFSVMMLFDDFWWVGLIIVAVVAALILYYLRNDLKEMRANEPKKIVLEDPVFNRKYTAYSTDEIGGRYLLTTAFMERFNNIRTSFGVNNIKCSFYGTSLMIAITTNEDLFEIGSLLTSLHNPKHIRKFINEINSIMDLIEYFKLDEKTGL